MYSDLLRRAAVAGIIASAVGLVLGVLISSAAWLASTSHDLYLSVFTLLQLIFIPGVAFFTYGLVVLGQKYGNLYLQILGYVSIVVGVINGIFVTIGLYTPAINNPYLDTILNTLLASVIGLGLCITLVPLYNRFPLIVIPLIATWALADLLALVGFPPNALALSLQLLGYVLGTGLLLRAASD